MIRPREAKLFTRSTATAAWGEAFYHVKACAHVVGSEAKAAWSEAIYADESHHRYLHRRDEEQNYHRNQNPFPAAKKTA